MSLQFHSDNFVSYTTGLSQKTGTNVFMISHHFAGDCNADCPHNFFLVYFVRVPDY